MANHVTLPCSSHDRKQVRPRPTRQHHSDFSNRTLVGEEIQPPPQGASKTQIMTHLCLRFATPGRYIASKTLSRKPFPPVPDVEAQGEEALAGPKS